MSFGLRIFGADGTLQLDENSFTMRIVYSATIAAPSGGRTYTTISVPGLTPANGTAFVVPLGIWGSSDMQLETEVINDGVRVYNYIRGREQYSNISGTTMRLFVIRIS